MFWNTTNTFVYIPNVLISDARVRAGVCDVVARIGL